MTNPTEPGAASVSERPVWQDVARLLQSVLRGEEPPQHDGVVYEAIAMGVLRREEQEKPCRTCGKPRVDFSYWQVSGAGRMLIAAYEAALTTPARSSGEIERMREALQKLLGPADDPNLGWLSALPKDKNKFACEFCSAEHECTLFIEHADDCAITQARAALTPNANEAAVVGDYLPAIAFRIRRELADDHGTVLIYFRNDDELGEISNRLAERAALSNQHGDK